MDKEKKSISITITDLDDLEKTVDSLDNLFRQVLLYYYDNNQAYFKYLVLSFTVYIGIICQQCGFDTTEFENEGEENGK